MSANCTDFCTGGGVHPKGHPATEPEDIAFILAWLDAGGIKAEPSAGAVAAVYRRGYGYHAAADALGIPHEQAYMLLTRPPGTTEDPSCE